MSSGVNGLHDSIRLLGLCNSINNQPVLSHSFLQKRKLRLRDLMKLVPSYTALEQQSQTESPDQSSSEARLLPFESHCVHWGLEQRPHRLACCWQYNSPELRVPGGAAIEVFSCAPELDLCTNLLNPHSSALQILYSKTFHVPHSNPWCQCWCKNCQITWQAKMREAGKGARGKRKWLSQHHARLDSKPLGTNCECLWLAWGAVEPVKKGLALVSEHIWLHSSLLFCVWVDRAILSKLPSSL